MDRGSIRSSQGDGPGAYPGAGGAEASGRYTITCTASRVINPPPIIWSSSGRIAWIRLVRLDALHDYRQVQREQFEAVSPQAGARAEAHNCPVDRGACIMALRRNSTIARYSGCPWCVSRSPMWIRISVRSPVNPCIVPSRCASEALPIRPAGSQAAPEPLRTQGTCPRARSPRSAQHRVPHAASRPPRSGQQSRR